MTNEQRANLIAEWYKSLAKYDMDICVRAWDKYKTEVRLREINLSLFIGFVKDIIAKDEREKAKQLPPTATASRDTAWEDAKAECMKKCEEVFGGTWK